MASYVERLEAWAEERGFEVRTFHGTQREPENVVQLLDAGSALLQRSSRDSVDTAAFYVVNCLERLGVEV